MYTNNDNALYWGNSCLCSSFSIFFAGNISIFNASGELFIAINRIYPTLFGVEKNIWKEGQQLDDDRDEGFPRVALEERHDRGEERAVPESRTLGNLHRFGLVARRKHGERHVRHVLFTVAPSAHQAADCHESVAELPQPVPDVQLGEELELGTEHCALRWWANWFQT